LLLNTVVLVAAEDAGRIANTPDQVAANGVRTDEIDCPRSALKYLPCGVVSRRDISQLIQAPVIGASCACGDNSIPCDLHHIVLEIDVRGASSRVDEVANRDCCTAVGCRIACDRNIVNASRVGAGKLENVACNPLEGVILNCQSLGDVGENA